MVTRSDRAGFFRQQDGTSMIEGLVVFPLVLLAFSVFFEFGYAVFQWNQTVKAMQLGVRLLAVSDPLTDLSSLTPTGAGGDPVPLDLSNIPSVSCGAGTTACDEDEMNRLVFGSDLDCAQGMGTSLPGMCDFNSRIRPANILVTYYRSGLGYIGRPDGQIFTITLQAEDLTFDLPLVGALLGFDDFTIPVHPATITSEDLCSTRSC